MSSPSITYQPVEDLRRRMDEEDLTQVEVAQALGVSLRTVQYWFAGAIPQKRYRRVLREWLASGNDEAAA
jgi:DNA-binding transcriptional regulator YiaG